MPKRSSKPRDLNALAARIVDEATDQAPNPEPAKDPAAVELGRRGGRKGGKVRAERLSAERRSEIARHAALARWSENHSG